MLDSAQAPEDDFGVGAGGGGKLDDADPEDVRARADAADVGDAQFPRAAGEHPGLHAHAARGDGVTGGIA